MKLDEIKFGDFALSFKILKDIGTPWIETDAYKNAIIDKNGKKLKSPVTSKEKDSYTSYNKIIFNLKRLLQKVVGKSSIAQRVVSTFLLKESTLEVIPEITARLVLEKLELHKSDDSIQESYIETFIEAHTE